MGGGRRDRDVHVHPDASPHVFVCGPTAFVEAAATLLLRAGHDAERVRTERFGGAA